MPLNKIVATPERFELPFPPRKGGILGQLDERVARSISKIFYKIVHKCQSLCSTAFVAFKKL